MALEFRVLELPLADEIETAIAAFDCCGEERAGDPVAVEVRDFLREQQFVQGIEEGFSTTYLILDLELDPFLLGYLTLSIDSVRLSEAEKRALSSPHFADFGAIRIVMIGTDVRHKGKRLGEFIVKWATGAARAISGYVAVRFLVADANVRLQSWYEGQKFEVNRSPYENPDAPGRTTVSMRLDLKLAGGQEWSDGVAPTSLP